MLLHKMKTKKKEGPNSGNSNPVDRNTEEKQLSLMENLDS